MIHDGRIIAQGGAIPIGWNHTVCGRVKKQRTPDLFQMTFYT